MTLGKKYTLEKANANGYKTNKWQRGSLKKYKKKILGKKIDDHKLKLNQTVISLLLLPNINCSIDLT